MTDREIEVEKKLLKNEQQTFDKLKQAYTQALADIKMQVKELQKNSEMPSKIYQIKYQQALKQQTSEILDILNNSNISTVDDFLTLMYEDGYAGIMYSLQGQDIPLAIPIDQNLLIKSISRETDSVKLSSRLYNNVEELKKTVIAEISRGIAGNQDYRDIAVVLSDKGNTSFKRAYTIARTEGHRVSIEAKSDAINKSIEKGADLVKMWDATLDGKTRHSHASLDHKWVENGESFTTVDDITGREVSAPFPGAFGIANMDINCRCVLLARPRWAVENEQFYEKWDNENRIYVTLGAKGGYDEWYKMYVSVNGLKDIANNGIINNKTNIPLNVISNIKSFDLPELSNAENEALRQAMQKLLKRVDGTPENTEYAFFYDTHVRFLRIKEGKPGESRVKLYHPSFDYIAIHNHPSGGTFSIGDIREFTKDLHLKTLIVVGNNGNQYVLQKTNSFNGNLFFCDYVNHLTNLKSKCNTVSEFLLEAEKFLKKEGVKYGVKYKSFC